MTEEELENLRRLLMDFQANVSANYVKPVEATLKLVVDEMVSRGMIK